MQQKFLREGESWRLVVTHCYSDSSERPLGNANVKNTHGIIIIIVMKCWLCGDEDVMINLIKSECSKLAQKVYKTRKD